ncbi:MAG TPA: YkvA family protein [Marmoricola sp.]|nr:YkvA family protein [Marmoricola sp.]
MWRDAAIGVAIGLVTCWAVLVVGLLLVRPRRGLLAEAVRILPDLLRLVTRMARDASLPRGVRWRLGLLLAYLALPVDLIPDFLPVVGYADDAIVIVWTLRSVVRLVGVEQVRDRWPGTDEGFAALRRLTGT